MNLQDFLRKEKIESLEQLVTAIKERGKSFQPEFVYQAAEYLNPNRDTTAAFYTDTAICQYIIKELPSFSDKDHLRILEPSVGAGNFIPFIAEKYKDKAILELHLIDIDENELKIAELIFETFYRDKYPNLSITYIHDDYLKLPLSDRKFDLVIGNPPYAKVKETPLLKIYRKSSQITKSSNLFVWFLEKAMHDGEWVSFIVPKSVLNAPEYSEIRSQLKLCHIASILDFGEYGFKGVKIETVNLLFTRNSSPSLTHIVSITQHINIRQSQTYITDPQYPVWLLYRNADFDSFANTLILGIFDVFRDRQIVETMVSPKGNYRVLKSRNIGSNRIIDIAGYDAYMNDISSLAVSKFLNRDNVVLIPNLSYSPRACFLPRNTIANGSVALLTVTDRDIVITEQDLELFSSKEFIMYYRIARNYGTRSLNIDHNSVYFFGIKR